MRNRALYVLLAAAACCLACLANGFACYAEPCDYAFADGEYLNCDNEDLLVFDRWDNDELFIDRTDGDCSPQDLLLARSSCFRAAELGFYGHSSNWATILLPCRSGNEAFSFAPRHTLSDFQHIMDCGLEYNGYAMNKRSWSRIRHECRDNDGEQDGIENGDGDGTVPGGCALPVPEPGSMALLGTGLIGLVGIKFRKG